ncbi:MULTISPECIES: acyl carrier protein [Pedobacter]|uniref:Acyl carrier protein n=1 Tax=Pedobacter heparinus (strain ATCC 13125 / DSM 2366 / CIP 104194 / JCM 7457 / NBRC 12017 / NCIMB 9290 / NRRL B-14731 / HIM 762-3) TaxID=485917 RepID=C6XUK2_PEDHD|nr:MULTISPECIES: phosphopantetheine-binding protein [Pedobacter]ACU03852.1 acyl carrier protein [Pedobacter heparinus DSM 2366]MBB5436626.1 acyl carrier protein [Pedobacter sp. AK017]
MDKEELIAKLKTIVAPYTPDKAALDNIGPTTDFIKDLKINSANLVDVVLDVEEEFDIEIDNQEMARMLNVSDTLAIIEAKLKTLDRE